MYGSNKTKMRKWGEGSPNFPYVPNARDGGGVRPLFEPYVEGAPLRGRYSANELDFDSTTVDMLINRRVCIGIFEWDSKGNVCINYCE